MSISYPISITDKDPNTFTFSPAELGITPVTTSSAVTIPTSDGDTKIYGSPKTLWIGKNASLNLIGTYSVGETCRHEIQSLAFEDGRTNINSNVTMYIVVASASDSEYNALEAELEARQQADPNYEPYSDWGYYYDLDGNSFYEKRTISDATESFSLNSEENWWVGFDGHSFQISKSVRLPEGLTQWKSLYFIHSWFDRHDWTFSNPTDFRIYIPSTVSSFKIVGEASSGDDYGDENILYFGYRDGWSKESLLLMGDSDSVPSPEDDNATEEIIQWLEDHPHDVVHIYLRNHTEVPDITFVGDIYFPIVFHVNGSIYNNFKNQYEGTVKFNPYGGEFNYDPITIVCDAGELPEIISVPLNTNLSPVALNGVQSLSDDDLSDAFAGIHLDWYKVNDAKINSVTNTSQDHWSFHQYIVETDLETEEDRIIHIVGSVELNANIPAVTVTSANYVTMSGSTVTATLDAISGIDITGILDSDGYVNMNTNYKGTSISESFNTNSN